ncbi:SNF2 family N-terminal domain-containing protein [Podospora conica]|nr:SNF2 family N-terminal domain-containing protein [Schizothecium conicum]
MSWNDGDKRDWDGFNDVDLGGHDRDLTEDANGGSWKRVCFEGGQGEHGNDLENPSWEWPGFVVGMDFPPPENQATGDGQGDLGNSGWEWPGFVGMDLPQLENQVMGDGQGASVEFGEEVDEAAVSLDVDMDAEGGCSPTPGTSMTPGDEPYDCCFGMLAVEVSCSPSFAKDFNPGPVTVTTSGRIVRLSFDESNTFAATFEAPVLVKLVRHSGVTLEATLPKPGIKKKKSADSWMTPLVVAQITVYGRRVAMYEVGDALSEAGLHLQHPSVDIDPNVQYFNPQYLLAPGATFPQPAASVAVSLRREGPLDELVRAHTMNQLNHVFDEASGPESGEYLLGGVLQSGRLKTTLHEHQMVALAMMVEKERGIIKGARFGSLWSLFEGEEGKSRYQNVVTGQTDPPGKKPSPTLGGVLADEMGLGKSLSLLALVAWHLDQRSYQEPSTTRSATATLVVAPKSSKQYLFYSCSRFWKALLMSSALLGWQKQIDRHIFLGKMRHAIYHGDARKSLSATLGSFDLVLTTYDTLRAEWASGDGGGLFQPGLWCRVVLDEAHRIRETSTKVHQAACALQSTYRWCLTGTPIQNRVGDYGALLKFLRVPPFTAPRMFDYWIASALSDPMNAPEGLRRLKVLIGATCLRRTKATILQTGLLHLPAREDHVEYVDLGPEDRELYDFFRDRAVAILSGLLSPVVETGRRQRHAEKQTVSRGRPLELIHILRRICDHGRMLLHPRVMQLYHDRQDLGSDAWLRGIEVGVEKTDEDEGDHPCQPASTIVDITPSAKVARLIYNIHREQRENTAIPNGRQTPVKSVVFSSWTTMLDLIESPLRKAGFSFRRIDGKGSLKQRAEALTAFSEDPSCTVLLASLGSAGEGIDLTAGNCVHLMEPHWNPMTETQALDRVHRIGQRRDVVTTRYIANDSIEMYVQDVQQRKLRAIDQSLAGADIEYTALKVRVIYYGRLRSVRNMVITNFPGNL